MGLEKGWHHRLTKLVACPNKVWQQVHGLFAGRCCNLSTEQAFSTPSVPSGGLVRAVFRPPSSRKTCWGASCARHLRRRARERAIGQCLTWPRALHFRPRRRALSRALDFLSPLGRDSFCSELRSGRSLPERKGCFPPSKV